MCNPVTTKVPEALLAKGVHNGFEWEVTNNGMGYRCGYVRIPPGHPWHGQDYDNVDASVHGGLTFAQPDSHCGKGGPDDAWWLGFDCAHMGDLQDMTLPSRDGLPLYPMPQIGEDNYSTVKTTLYVASECKDLIDQAIEAAFPTLTCTEDDGTDDTEEPGLEQCRAANPRG